MSASITEFENAVRKVAVFRSATDDDVHSIARLGIQRAVEEDSYFFFQGERADNLHILLSGRAKLCTISADGQQVNLRTLVPNQLFGAVGAVDPKANYPACAQALEDSTSLAIESDAFANLLTERPHLSFGLMRLMTGYIQEMQERYSELATERVEQRIARALLRLTAQSGRKNDQGGIDLAFSRDDRDHTLHRQPQLECMGEAGDHHHRARAGDSARSAWAGTHRGRSGEVKAHLLHSIKRPG
jgi:CRP-like cAMP-binding protein